MDLGLTHKVAMVGGASKGLGFAVARALAAEGVDVSIASRDEEGIKRAADTINAAGGGRAVCGVAAPVVSGIQAHADYAGFAEFLGGGVF